MKTATVVGAGIAGPAAAINLQQQGYAVTLLEKRERSEIDSNHMLTIGDTAQQILMDQFGVKWGELFRYDDQPVRQETSNGREFSWGETALMPSPPQACWNDLHDALASRCDITYSHHVESQPDTDVVVWADGIGSYGRKSHGGGRGTYS